jgi:hypothetical protein
MNLPGPSYAGLNVQARKGLIGFLRCFYCSKLKRVVSAFWWAQDEKEIAGEAFRSARGEDMPYGGAVVDIGYVVVVDDVAMAG